MAAPGERVALESGRVHVIRRGSGSPAVVFEAGAASPAIAWRQVQDAVSGFAATIAWDRPGSGWSDPLSEPTGLESGTSALHTLLKVLDVPPPYVLVGHSLGALYVRHFAARFPQQVAGIVLVDPTHEHQLEALSRPARAAQTVALVLASRASGLVARLSRRRLLSELAKLAPDLSAEELRETLVELTAPGRLKLQFAETRRVLKEARDLDRRPGCLGDLPLVVLAAGRMPAGPRFARHRREIQIPELAALSTRGEVLWAEESGHGIPAEAPEAVVAAIRATLAGEVRHGVRGG